MVKLVFLLVPGAILCIVILAIGRGWILQGDDQSCWDKRMIAMGIPLLAYAGVTLFFVFSGPR